MDNKLNDFFDEINAIAPKKDSNLKIDVIVSKPPENPVDNNIKNNLNNINKNEIIKPIENITNKDNSEIDNLNKQKNKEKKEKKNDFMNKSKRKFYRIAGGEKWYDPTLAEWPENDYRIFVGNLGNEVTEDNLKKVFFHFKSISKIKVVRDKRSSKTKGYGFISFSDADECIEALRSLNGKYCGNKPMVLKVSEWKKRQQDVISFFI